MSSVLQNVCVYVCSHGLDWSIRTAEALEICGIYFSLSPLHQFWLTVASICLPPSHSSSGSEVAWLSIYPWEQPDVIAFAWKKLWADALKLVNANESYKALLWSLSSGEGPSHRFCSAGILPCMLLLQRNYGGCLASSTFVFSEIIPAPR